MCMRGDDGLLVFRVKCEFGQEKGNVITYCVRMPSNTKSDNHDVAVACLQW